MTNNDQILTTRDLLDAAMRSSFEDGRVVMAEPFAELQQALQLFEKTVWTVWFRDQFLGDEPGWEAELEGIHMVGRLLAGRILVTFRESTTVPEPDEYLSIIGADGVEGVSLQGLRMTAAKAIAMLDLASDPALRDACRICNDLSIV